MSDNSEAQRQYLAAQDEAVRWAELNRELIAKRCMEATRLNGECLLDVNHNLVTPKNIEGVTGWLHRKGATPSDAGFVVIPGSRGDYSYLVEPTASDQALFSLAHGRKRRIYLWIRGPATYREYARGQG